MTRAFWCAFGWLLLHLAFAGPASAAARPIELRDALCIQSAPFVVDTAPGAGGMHFCKAVHRPSPGGWTWLRLDSVQSLRRLPGGWQLLIDQTRFTRIALQLQMSDGTWERMTLGAGHIGDHWAPGGLLRYTIDRPGGEVRALLIGFQDLDTLKLMRKVTAVSAADAQPLRERWFILFGLFVGALISAFAYNLVIYTGQRYPFQRWYLLWAGTALIYGLFWTNMIALLWPDLAGPTTVRVDFISVGVLIGAGHMFFLSVLEPGMVPRRLEGMIKLLAAAAALSGLVASMDGIFPPEQMDALFNDILALGTLSVLLAVCIAVRRKSRVIWFYLAGWSPVLCVFALRLLRNFGLLPQEDVVDMGTFGALAIESIVMSLAIADRFRLLRQERDAAEQAQKVSAAEAKGHRRAALTDFLTGLGNRAAFHEALQEQIRKGDPRGFTLLLIDVDHLKEANDRLGHDGGDALLRVVAESLGGIAYAGMSLHRIGGDEFALIAPDTSSRDVERLCTALAGLQGHRWSFLGHAGKISLSLGSAHYPMDARDGGTLYSNADLALYQAKAGGRRRHCRYEAGLRDALDRKNALVHEAYRSVGQDRFVLHFQPLVNIVDGACIGHEALLRWRHPDYGLIAPDMFADVLIEEDIGLLIQEDVLNQALDALERRPGKHDFLCVNFTAAQLQGVRSAEHILDCLAARNILPGRLCVEVTEGIVLEQRNGGIAAALQILHEAGVRIALDDFGTGYASLLHLQQIPTDTLKIDRSFVANLGQDDGDAEEIVRAIIGLGAGLRKTVIAEGIETAEQREALIKLGCRYGQGYLFGRPSPHLRTTGDFCLTAQAA